MTTTLLRRSGSMVRRSARRSCSGLHRLSSPVVALGAGRQRIDPGGQAGHQQQFTERGQPSVVVNPARPARMATATQFVEPTVERNLDRREAVLVRSPHSCRTTSSRSTFLTASTS